jgi:hypothetical protein
MAPTVLMAAKETRAIRATLVLQVRTAQTVSTVLSAQRVIKETRETLVQ